MRPRLDLSVAALALVAMALTSSSRAEDDRVKVEVVPQTSHRSHVTSVAFSPDGRLALTAAETTIKLWDVATGKLVRTIDGHVENVRSIAVSPDGRSVISGASDAKIRQWDLATGQLVREFASTLSLVYGVAFSPDGAKIAAGGFHKSWGAVELWDLSTGRLLRRLEKHPEIVNSVAFSPDGRTLVSGSGTFTGNDFSIKVWSASSGKLIRTLTGHASQVNSVAFSPDGRFILSGSDDRQVRLWDAASGKLLRVMDDHQAPAMGTVAFSPDGGIILAGTLRRWDLASGATLPGFSGELFSSHAAYSPDGRTLLAALNGDYITLIDAKDGAELHRLGPQSDVPALVSFLPDGKSLFSIGLSGWVNSMNVLDIGAGRMSRAKADRGYSYVTALSPDGRSFVSSGESNAITMRDVATGNLMRSFGSHTLHSIAFAPDGRAIVSGGADARAKLWDVATGTLLHTLVMKTANNFGDVDSVAISPDGRNVLSTMDKTIYLWDAATGAQLRILTGHRSLISAAIFSPDGQLLVSGGADGIKLWSVSTGALLRSMDDQEWVKAISFAPNGGAVLSGSAAKTVKLWDVATGALLKTFEGHSGSIMSVAFSADGSRIASAADDLTIRLWKVENGRPLATFVTFRGSKWIALTPDGFFNASSPKAADLIGITRGLGTYGINQLWQSLYAPDLVREKLANDPNGEVQKAAEVVSLNKVLDSGKAPAVAISIPSTDAKSADEIITAEATITEQEGGGIGRIEWRVNGITVRVSTPATGSTVKVEEALALDPGENAIEVVAYNGRDLLASVPAKATITWTGTTGAVKPKLHVLSIGINKYVDKGGVMAGETEARRFPPLGLAVRDAKVLADELKKAGQGFYDTVQTRVVLDEEATAANLDVIVTQMAKDISPRDTFVLYAATHGYSYQGGYYLIPQDYQGGPNPNALATRAVGQLKLQDWIANRIRAKKALILLDSCESGALTAGYTRSRFSGSVSDAAIGRLHEATGRPVLTAASLGQSALELTELGHGVFTSALIDSFYRGDTNRDGMVSIAELVSHVQDLVPRLLKDPEARAEVIRRGPIGGVQSARFGGRGEDFAFVRRLP